MAVAAWRVYNTFLEYMADGTIDLDEAWGAAAGFNMHLAASNSNASDATLSALTSLTNELASANGYTLSGKCVVQTWATGASANEMRWDATAVIWTASGGNLGNSTAIKFAVIVATTGTSTKDSANKLCCWSKLSTSGFTVSTGNTLTITPAAGGIFELNES